MMSQERIAAPRVEVSYSPLEGCTLKAVTLSQDIRRCYEIPVQVRVREDGVFEVTVNGVSIYRRAGVCDPREGSEAVFLHLDQYWRRRHDLPAPRDTSEDEKDERYQAWLRAMCSGE